MRKFLASLLLSLLVAVPSQSSVSTVMDSVIKFQAGKGHCTAWSVSVARWITQAHCVDELPLAIDGVEVKVVSQDVGGDLAMLEGPVAPPLPVSQTEPVFDYADGTMREITLYGWPGTYPGKKPLVFTGHLAALNIEQVEELDQFDHHNVNLFASSTGAGMSGGPIIQGGKVVGMCESGLALGWPNNGLVSLGHVTASQTVKQIRKFAGLKK